MALSGSVGQPNISEHSVIEAPGDLTSHWIKTFFGPLMIRMYA
jgi:hypothetical protein